MCFIVATRQDILDTDHSQHLNHRLDISNALSNTHPKMPIKQVQSAQERHNRTAQSHARWLSKHHDGCFLIRLFFRRLQTRRRDDGQRTRKYYIDRRRNVIRSSYERAIAITQHPRRSAHDSSIAIEAV
jgi:hypothetical protein